VRSDSADLATEKVLDLGRILCLSSQRLSNQHGVRFATQQSLADEGGGLQVGGLNAGMDMVDGAGKSPRGNKRRAEMDPDDGGGLEILLDGAASPLRPVPGSAPRSPEPLFGLSDEEALERWPHGQTGVFEFS